ncbi:hypothetical protein F5B22DRAFT_648651 [Xylaria bambusicola]|uniref:uncharacterized protein n=1 Tax=Xylaria bambusicola TaxID=326684 RepID=UPI0020078FAA|nr:uncharacterized protein F5B22DRAFT_648651 [Xylaria bambusicola]KAI0512547.1 hypothetical protein F5B22DRAFT_648651 [Xylaria bambusicola]
MEQHHFPRRSASHGTLRSSYSSHGGPAPGLPPFRPLHKPLRSVNENSVLLHSPGALESMLKTTTETGDIGIFTIRPVPPSPLLPRDSLSETGYPHWRPRRSVDNLYRQNQTMRPPSHRDATSEVFSVYGSDSLKSGTSTLSPTSTEDAGQRSYSMTTCGSRHLSHHRSTNTLQSQASGSSQLQRPRSPFPYPTRLKRPGVRPASPAVTENGRIDYSRMVEIDRVSYRTVHSHFKHVCSPMARRPPPLGLRADINRSTPSLAPPGPPPNRGPPRPRSIRTHSPASMASWNPPYHERLDSTAMRTSSLTSVTNIYRRVPPMLRDGQNYPPQTSPRYYDYTEDFEDKDSQLTPLTHTFTPLRAQMVRYPRSTMCRDDDDYLATRHLAAVFGEGDSAFFDCESQVVDEQDVPPVLTTIPSRSQSRAESIEGSISHRPDSAISQNSTIELDASELGGRNARSSDIDLLPSQIGRESIDTFNPSLDLESRDLPLSYKCVTYHAHTAPKTQKKSPERRVQVFGGRAPTIRSEQGVILRDDTHYETIDKIAPESHQLCAETGTGEPDELHESSDVSYHHVAGVPEASTANGPQGTLFSSSHTENMSPSVGLDPHGSCGSACPLAGDAVAEPEETRKEETKKSPDNNGVEISCPNQFRRHRRNHAALRISTTGIPRKDNEGHPHITPTCSMVPLVSPKPISPARQLKVKNSIPQLMKALPPLPGVLGYGLPSPATEIVDEDDFAEILVPFSFHGSDEPLQLNKPQAPNPVHMMRDEAILTPQKESPKFKLKIKTSGLSEASNSLEHNVRSTTNRGIPRLDHMSGVETIDGSNEMQGRNQDRNRFKVKSPRHRSGLSSSQYSTVRHNPRVEASEVVAELMRQKSQDLFGGPLNAETMLLQERRKPLSHLVYSYGVNKINVSDSTSMDRGIESIRYRIPLAMPNCTNELPRMGSEGLTSSIPCRGLIKRLSNLRTLLSSSSTLSIRQTQELDGSKLTKVTANTLASSDINVEKSVSTTESTATEAGQLRVRQRIRAKLNRWVKGAKAAMRKYGRNTYNHHKQDSKEGGNITHV